MGDAATVCTDRNSEGSSVRSLITSSGFDSGLLDSDESSLFCAGFHLKKKAPARSNDAKDRNQNSEYDTWAGQCYLVFTRRIQPAHITVTSHTLKKKELQGKFRDFKTRFLWEEFRRICGFALLSLDEKRIIKISPIPPACSSPVARIHAETGSQG